MKDPYLPQEARIIERIQESNTVYTLRLELTDATARQSYQFAPGQFNMVYLYGVGEVAISIVSDPDQPETFSHTIRAVGRVTRALAKLQPGDSVGIRGPFGQGWPLDIARDQDVVVLTGGLGCAPVVAAIHYIIQRHAQFGRLYILQGVKHSDDFIFYQRYQQWMQAPNTQVMISADQASQGWPWFSGRILDQVQMLALDPKRTVVMMCGPEIMMRAAAEALLKKQVPEERIYLSMERNMECAMGHCGHCQYGGLFICKEGPVLAYPRIKPLFGVSGF